MITNVIQLAMLPDDDLNALFSHRTIVGAVVCQMME